MLWKKPKHTPAKNPQPVQHNTNQTKQQNNFPHLMLLITVGHPDD